MTLRDLVDFAFQVGLAIGQLALFIYVRNTNRNDEVDRRFLRLQADLDGQGEKIGAELSGLAQRLSHIETAVEGSPTHSDMGDVYAKVNTVDSKLSRVEGKVDGMADTLRLLLARVAERGMK